AVRRRLRQDEKLFEIGQPFTQLREVVPAGGEKLRQVIELRQSDRRLHVGDLQVKSEVAVGVFMIVAARQLTELPRKALAAGIVLSGRTVAVAAPVADRLGGAFEDRAAHKDRTTLPHRDVMRRVKAQGSDVAECSDLLAGVFCPERIAAILDDKQIMA